MGKPRILVVEDERDVSKVISINLKLEGMEVLEVHDGPSGIEMIEQEKPDCVVLDIMLPKMSGWDIIRQMKSNPATADIPVVMVTAKVAERDQLRGLGAGAVKYITKPFSPIALTEAIKSVLKPQVRDEVAKERRETIERLQLSTLHNISDILISSPALDELLEGVADKLIALFELPLCAVVLSNDQPEVYSFKEALGQPGRSTSKSTVPSEVDTAMREAFSSNRRPARIKDIEGLDTLSIFPGSQVDDSGYVLPLIERDNYLGCIILAGKSDAALSADEEDLLATIANQVAAAVARAKLHESLREDEIIHRRLLHQMISAQESERSKLATEIHDSLVQSLVGLSYRLQALKNKVPAETGVPVIDEMEHIEGQLNDIIKELREMLVGLRLPMLEDMGLFTAMRTTLKNYGIAHKVQTSYQAPDELPRLTKDAQINIYRAIQEALKNIEKHAGAMHVTIDVDATPRKLHINIRDDGKGFVPGKVGARERHLGIAGMRERIELLGGNFTIRSEPGQGTILSMDVPLGPILEDKK